MRITFDTNMFLHNLEDIEKYPIEDGVVVLLPVIAELDNIKNNSKDMDLKYRGRKATKYIKEHVELGLIKPLEYPNDDYLYEIKPLNKFEVIDDLIISICKEESIKLITRDYNVFLKCKNVGVECEIVENENKIENLSMIYKGVQEIYTSSDVIDKVHKNGYINVEELQCDTNFNENECLTLISYSNPKHTALTKYSRGYVRRIKYEDNQSYWGLKPKNAEQKYALSLLADDDIRIVSMTGVAGSSKAQPNDTPIPTPDGWTTIGALKVGDYVFDRLGNPTKVLGVYSQGTKPTYKITFSDGRSTLCADEHLWDIYTPKRIDNKRRGKNTQPLTINTLEIIDRFNKINEENKNRKHNRFLYIQNNGVVKYEKKELPVHPYVLGVLLGDGCLTCCGLQMSSSEEDVVSKVANIMGVKYHHSGQNNYTWIFETISSKDVRYVKKYLSEIGLNSTAYHKFIPKIYLESSVEDRLELLKGLMDTDGTVGKKNRLSFSTTSPRLRDDFVTLCRSLGYITSIYKPTIADRKHDLYTICIQTNDKIFSSDKHNRRWEEHIKNSVEKIGKYNNEYIRIVNIERVEDKENTCIYVENDEHLYLTENYLVTHNTILSFAVGLELKVNNFGKGKLYIARPPISLSRKLQQGFKPGTTIEKAIGTLGSYSTNLERLSQIKGDGRKIDGSRLLMDMLEQCEISYLNLEDILGMSFSDEDYIIIDEAELLTKDEMKAILTRGGKIIVLGDVEQGGDSKVDYENSGLLHLIEVGKKSPLIAHITLQTIYRSEIVKEINEIW